MNFDLGRFLKVKVKDKFGDSQLIGLEFLSMYKKFHHSTTNNKEVMAEKRFCILDLALALTFDLFQPKLDQLIYMCQGIFLPSLSKIPLSMLKISHLNIKVKCMKSFFLNNFLIMGPTVLIYGV